MKKLCCATLGIAGLVLCPRPVLAQCDPQRLVPPVGVETRAYGRAIAMSDDRLVAGDPTAARCAAPDSCFAGAVHAYRMVGGAWVLQQTVVPPDSTYGDRFGYHVDLDGDRMIVGSVFAQLAGFSAGAAYFYEFDGGEWVETARVAPPEPIAWSDFGSTVAIEGALAAVTQRQGVYVFEQVAPGQWAWSDTLTPPDGVPLTAAFGAELLLTSEWLFVGAPFDRTLGPNGGAVYGISEL